MDLLPQTRIDQEGQDSNDHPKQEFQKCLLADRGITDWTPTPGRVQAWRMRKGDHQGNLPVPDRLAECALYTRVYTPSDMGPHLYRHRNNKFKNTHLKVPNGGYPCIVSGCSSSPFKCRTDLLSHLARHRADSLEKAGRSPEALLKGDHITMHSLISAANSLKTTSSLSERYMLKEAQIDIRTVEADQRDSPQDHILSVTEIGMIQQQSQRVRTLNEKRYHTLCLELSIMIQEAKDADILITGFDAPINKVKRMRHMRREFTYDQFKSDKQLLNATFHEFKLLKFIASANLKYSDSLLALEVVDDSVALYTRFYNETYAAYLFSKYRQKQSIYCLMSLVDAMTELHIAGIVHRGLTPDCIAIDAEDDEIVFLKNFSQSCSRDETAPASGLRQSLFIARGKEWPGGSTDYDSYSLGVFVLAIQLGEKRFKSQCKQPAQNPCTL